MLDKRKVGLWLSILLYSANLLATEVKEIRFGQTEQRARLVIESDQELSYTQRWHSEELVLEISNLSSAIESKVLSASAIGAGVKLQLSEKNTSSKIYIPVTREALIKIFPLSGAQNATFRLIIDWKRIAANASQSEVLQHKAAQQTPLTQSDTSSLSLRQQAEISLTNADYRKAIGLLTKLMNEGPATDRPFALEFLGVARERIHQLAFAKQFYQQFLSEFSESENAPRVKQRLDALIGIQNLAKSTTLKGSSRKVTQSRNTTRGTLALDYRSSDLVNDLGERSETLSLASIDYDIRGDYAVGENNLQMRISGAHYEDLLEPNNQDTERLRYVNVSWQNRERTYRIDVGRQRSRGKGIFGRYDGALVGFSVQDKQKLNFVFGYPVDSSKQLSLDPERRFFGVSYDWEDLWEGFDMSLFAIQQNIGDLTDRQAIGGEFKYLQQRTSYYGLLDFDVFYSELNALLVSGSHTTDSKTRYYWSINHRKSPYISTRNALIGQPADSLQELQNLFITDEEILDLALDRTLQSSNASLQISQPLNKDFDISGNITWLDLSGAPTSGGVPEIADTGGQVYLNLYLGANRLYSERDSSQFGVRYSSLSNANVISVFASTRYRWLKGWSVNGKIRLDDRQSDNGATQQSFSPSARVQFQNREQLFYAEFGGIFYTNQSQGFAEINTDIYYIYAGYQYYF